MRFEIRNKGKVDAELRRALKSETERREIIEAKGRTGEEMA